MAPDSSHPVPGKGAGPTTNGHSHITACIQMASFDANPCSSGQRPAGGAHAVEGWCLQEDDLLEGIPSWVHTLASGSLTLCPQIVRQPRGQG